MANNRIILISIDNLRADCLSANPDKSVLAPYALSRHCNTPTLDGLISSGVFFPRCFSAASYTTASHASILTGLFPARHGIREYYHNGLGKNVRTLFQILKAIGYDTLLATDFPFLIGPNLGFTRSVDQFIDQNENQALSWLEEHRDRPAFAFVHFGSVHNPFGLTSLEFDGDYFVTQVTKLAEKVGVPPIPDLGPEWPERKRSREEQVLRQRYFHCTDALYQRGQYGDLMQLYVDGIEYFDGNRFHKFIERLQNSGLLDDAVVAILADHGEEYSTRAFAHFNGLWEGIINVPLIVLGPEVPHGIVRHDVCRTVDVVPTLLDLAGVSTLETGAGNFDGLSLRSLFNSDSALRLKARGETWFGHTEKIRGFMEQCLVAGQLLPTPHFSTVRLEYLRDENWKFILRTDLETGEETPSIYRVEQDRTESSDLSATQGSLCDLMKHEITQYRGASFHEELNLENKALEDLRAELKDIGYLT
jgi:choline-sulfatase